MEAILKREKRRKTKLFTKLYYTLTIIGIVSFFAMMLMIITVESLKTFKSRITIMPCIMAFILILIFAGVVFGIFAQTNGQDLLIYKKKIILYRAYKNFNYVVTLLSNKEYQKAINFYNSMQTSGVKNDLYLYLVAVLKTGMTENVEMVEKNHIAMIDQFNPDKVFN
jgi:glucan phosphoethanolaminetransferase (alkaline phosphatase superfamily)